MELHHLKLLDGLVRLTRLKGLHGLDLLGIFTTGKSSIDTTTICHYTICHVTNWTYTKWHATNLDAWETWGTTARTVIRRGLRNRTKNWFTTNLDKCGTHKPRKSALHEGP